MYSRICPALRSVLLNLLRELLSWNYFIRYHIILESRREQGRYHYSLSIVFDLSLVFRTNKINLSYQGLSNIS